MDHDLPFDPTYGYTLEGLLKVDPPAAPADFESFWRQTYEQTRRTEPEPQLVAIPDADPDHELYEITFTGLGGFRVGGWVTVPRTPVTRGMIIGHGYGGRCAPDFSQIGPPAIRLLICGRGFHRSARPELPDCASAHVVHGIEHRDTYIHRFCVSDMWSAVSALTELFPQVSDWVDYYGGSFGGGIGALTIPWEHRFRRAFLDVPSFGNHPLRVNLEMTGSGASVRKYYLEHPEVLEVLKYYDAATAARFVRIPTFVGAALFDPAVPPPGQFSVYNALTCPKKLFVRRAAHFAWPGQPAEEAQLKSELDEWFSPVKVA
jgi:cephalosporin-C deacetylase